MNYRRLIKRVLIGLLSLVLLIAISGFIIIRYYEDEVVAYAIERVKKGLVTDMNIGDADLSFWSTFPHASIRFKDVYIQETFEEKDTLAYAGELSLGFSLSDLFAGNYRIQDIVVKRAEVFMRLDDKGNDNWHFWKATENDTSRISFAIEDVELSEFNFVYEDMSSRFFVDVRTEEMDAEGAFTPENLDFEIELNALVSNLISGNESLLSDRQTNWKGKIQLNPSEEKISFSDGTIEVDDLKSLVNVSYRFGVNQYIDAHLQGEKIDLNRIRKFLPEGMVSTINEYDLGGKMDLTATVKGPISDKKSPDIRVEISLSDGEMTDKGSGAALRNVAARAVYTAPDGKADKLELNQLSANLGRGSVQLSGNLDDLQKPVIDLQLSAEAGLDQLKNFLKLDTLEVCTGYLRADAKMAGRVRIADDGSPDWSALTFTGSAQLSDAHIKLVGSSREFTQMNGTFLFSGGNASVQEFSGFVSGSDFKLNGTMNNLIPYLMTTTEYLEIDASLYSSHVNVNELLEKNTSSKTDEVYALQLPNRMRARFNAGIGLFEFREFKATDVKGVIAIDDNKVSADPIAFQTAGGSWMTQFGLQKTSSSTYQVRCNSTLDKIDITELFREFENFGQGFVTDKHLKGRTNAKVQFEAQISPSLDIASESITSVIDISIDNGQLIGLESLQSIAEYIRNNKWVAPFVNEDKFAEKLKDVKFSRLENVIEIRDRQILIPFMEIKTSAMDISVRGKHGFDKKIDYTIGFNLRDILVRKYKEWEEVDDGLGKQMFLYMRGTTEHPDFGMDKDASKENRQQEIAEEKQNVKALLKQEFGLFKKDDSVGTYKKDESKPGSTMTINWEESDQSAAQEENTVSSPKPKDPEVKKTVDNSTTTKSGKKLPKWLQEKK
jgi:uncharacterized protein involved in outer membrane biogenesis